MLITIHIMLRSRFIMHIAMLILLKMLLIMMDVRYIMLIRVLSMINHKLSIMLGLQSMLIVLI